MKTLNLCVCIVQLAKAVQTVSMLWLIYDLAGPHVNGVARTLKMLRTSKGCRQLLNQAVILFNYLLFQMGTSFKGKNLLPKGVNSFL